MYDDLTIHRAGGFYVRPLADSISPDGVRLATLETRYPRWLHPEVLRHRVASHSVESNRAVPLEDKHDEAGNRIHIGTISRVREDPYVPTSFNERVKGMGVGAELAQDRLEAARVAWLEAAERAADSATTVNNIGIDKSRANRLMEPFLWVKDIISATEWTNFLALRCPPGDNINLAFPAQLEFQQLAILVRQALRTSTPQQLEPGWWHLPGATGLELHQLCQMRQHSPRAAESFVADLKRACSRRLAKISFDKHATPEDISLSIDKYGELVGNGHYSPTEHIARPMTLDDIDNDTDDDIWGNKIMVPAGHFLGVAAEYGDGNYDGSVDVSSIVKHLDVSKCWAGNFRGWMQHRKEIAGEHDHSLLLDYEVI